MWRWGWLLVVLAACSSDVETSDDEDGTPSGECTGIDATADLATDMRALTAGLRDQVLASCTAIATDLGSLGPVDGATAEEQVVQACGHAAEGIEASYNAEATTLEMQPVSCTPNDEAEASCLSTCGAPASCADICEATAWVEGSCDTLQVTVTGPDSSLNSTLIMNLPVLLVAATRAELVMGAAGAFVTGVLTTDPDAAEACGLDISSVTSDATAAATSLEAAVSGGATVMAALSSQ